MESRAGRVVVDEVTTRLGRALLRSFFWPPSSPPAQPQVSLIETPFPTLNDRHRSFRRRKSYPGRLLVLGAENEITTMRPDGSDVVILAGSDIYIEPDPTRPGHRTDPEWRGPNEGQVTRLSC